jgi:hypothetical protein
METPGLIRAAQRGNLQAFNVTLASDQDSVYTLVCWIVASELESVPAVFAIAQTAYQELHEYHQEEFRFRLYRIAVRECSLALRKKTEASGARMAKTSKSTVH